MEKPLGELKNGRLLCYELKYRTFAGPLFLST